MLFLGVPVMLMLFESKLCYVQHNQFEKRRKNISNVYIVIFNFKTNQLFIVMEFKKKPKKEKKPCILKVEYIFIKF